MRIRPGLLPWIAAAMAVTAVSGAAAQPLVQAMALSAPRLEASPVAKAAVVTADSRKDQAPWWAPVASAVVPGTGQLALGQQRGVAYLVAEVYLVVQAISARQEWDRDRTEYRSIAADVARRQFGGDLPIGPWEYYEAMEGPLESGVFDKVPGGRVDPETDTETYNGATWQLARTTHWADPNSPPAADSPEYQRALDFYEARAIRDDYRWSWRDARLERDVYRQYIASSNRSYQRSVSMVSLVGMNHLVSLIDAYVTVRIRRYGGVRVAGLSLEGIESDVRTVGDPALKRYRFSSALRFAPAER